MKGLGTHWSCISGCGACCRLDPDRRGEAIGALDEEQRKLYLSMVGPDGWCIHYDSGGRRCRIYDQRPSFCRVENLAALFGVPAGESAAFAIACCSQQIRDEYGGRSPVMHRFARATRTTDARLPS